MNARALALLLAAALLASAFGVVTAQHREMLDQAWQYIQEAGDYPIVTRYEEGAADDVILRVMEEEQADLLLLGGYGYQPLLKAFLGSTVDTVLRRAWFPVLICR